MGDGKQGEVDAVVDMQTEQQKASYITFMAFIAIVNFLFHCLMDR